MCCVDDCALHQNGLNDSNSVNNLPSYTIILSNNTISLSILDGKIFSFSLNVNHVLRLVYLFSTLPDYIIKFIYDHIATFERRFLESLDLSFGDCFKCHVWGEQTNSEGGKG